MKYTGKAHAWSDGEASEFDAHAVLTKNRIAIDWEESGDTGHLNAEVADRAYFRGHYEFTEPDTGGTFDLRKYTSDDKVILFGTWTNRREGLEGKWLFVLWPVAEGE